LPRVIRPESLFGKETEVRTWIKRLFTIEPAPVAYTPPRVPQPGTPDEVARRAELLSQALMRHLQVASDHALVRPSLYSTQFRSAIAELIARYEEYLELEEHERLGSQSAELVARQREREKEFIGLREDELRSIIGVIAKELGQALQDDARFANELQGSLTELAGAAELDDLRAVRQQIRATSQKMTGQLEQQTKRSQTRIRQLEAEIDVLYGQLGMVAMESKTDSLTGLHNKISYESQLGIEVGLAERRGRQLSLMLVSLEDMRAHQDAHGEDVANELIKAVGERLLKEYFRKTDFVARLSGEHFAVLMSQTDLDSAQKATQRWCKQLSKVAIETTAGIIKVTVSAGISQWERGEAPPSFHQRAQRALGRALERGSGQVMASPGGKVKRAA